VIPLISTPSLLPSSSRLWRQQEENPKGASTQGASADWGQIPKGRRGTGKAGEWVFVRRRPRVRGVESER
jgi:hypothetical protein